MTKKWGHLTQALVDCQILTLKQKNFTIRCTLITYLLKRKAIALTFDLLCVVTYRCKILDRHLVILSKKHLETKFLKLNVEKAPFLCERLRIKVIPTLALLKEGKAQDYVVGFTDLGNTDDFTTETLEWRLGCSDILNYR